MIFPLPPSPLPRSVRPSEAAREDFFPFPAPNFFIQDPHHVLRGGVGPSPPFVHQTVDRFFLSLPLPPSSSSSSQPLMFFSFSKKNQPSLRVIRKRTSHKRKDKKKTPPRRSPNIKFVIIKEGVFLFFAGENWETFDAIHLHVGQNQPETNQDQKEGREKRTNIGRKTTK